MAGFVPTGVMVMHKVLLTAESPQDVADAVLACKMRPTEGVQAIVHYIYAQKCLCLRACQACG